jgi:mannosyltransferase
MTRHEIVGVSVLTALGAGVRVFHLGTQSLWLDELFSVFLARREWGQVIWGTAQGDTNPPLFNLSLHLALQFGTDEVAVRAVSCLFGVAAIPLFYALARALLGTRAAFIASGLVVFSPFYIFFAQEARMYTQLAFFALAAMFFFWRAWQSGRRQDWLFFVVFETLAFYSHSLAFLNLLALDVFGLTQRAQWRERWRALVIANLAIVILFAPWLVILVQQATRVQSGFWGTTPSPLVLLMTPYLLLFANAAPAWAVPFTLFITFALLVMGGLAVRRALRAGGAENTALVFALMVLGVPLLTLYVLSLVRPMFVERTLIAASFGLCLWLGWLATRATSRVVNVALVRLLLVAMVAVLPNYYFNPDAHKPPMREAARAVAARFQAGDAVVHTSDSSALAFLYYAPQLPNEFLAGDPDYVTETTRGRSGRIAGLVPREMSEVIVGHSRVWLVVALDHNIEYQKARVAEFDRAFTRQEHASIGGIDVLLYEVKP